MKTVDGNRFCQVLEARGWKPVRTRGSHRISVPVHGGASLKRGLRKHLMKLADIHESEL